VFVVSKNAQRGDIQVEGFGRPDIQVHPGDGDRPQKVAVRESKNAAFGGRSGERDELDGPRPDLRRGLTTRAPVFVELPVGARFKDRLGREALVFAVVDLAQQRRQMGVGKACYLGCSLSSLQRARIDRVEFQRREAVAQDRGLLFAMSGER
jgi:hypothetical protein